MFSYLHATMLPFMATPLSETQSLLLVLVLPWLGALASVLFLSLLLALSLAVAGLAGALASLATICAFGLFGLASLATVALLVTGVATGVALALIAAFASSKFVYDVVCQWLMPDLPGEGGLEARDNSVRNVGVEKGKRPSSYSDVSTEKDQ